MPLMTILGSQLEVRMIPGTASQCPPLVFLHEGLGCVGLWHDFPDRVSRRVAAPATVYSRAGYGRSDDLKSPRDVNFMHEEALVVLPALLDALGIINPILIGHSDGASIALIHAAAAQRPTAAVVLMAPHVFVEPCTLKSISRLVAAYRTTDLRDRLARHHVNVDGAFLGWSRIWMDPRFLSWNLAGEVSALDVPTLVIQGNDDPYGSCAHADAIVSAAPGKVQRVDLAGCGHAPHREQKDAVLDAISGFIERVVAARIVE